jgi:hypothetical protein
MEKIMKKLNNIALGIASLAFTLSTQAAIVTFGGVTPTDGSQKTSGRSEIQWINSDGSAAAPGVVTNIIDPTSGFFIETFDQATANPFFTSRDHVNYWCS